MPTEINFIQSGLETRESFSEKLSIKRIVCLSLSVSVCLNASAQFSRYEAQSSQAGLGGTGRGGVYGIPWGSEIKGYHPKNVIQHAFAQFSR